ncbi:4-hydroxy-tetrahydrodipicolinate synthase [Terriglobus roseus]|uniref:4-hydroxy-tetrahydrodipicolinate synthase n=1 Tax=Terriglobus roseus TaxID=392734 RepID=A0A1H4S0F9_9BACT|nr:4-hydroxy-tetrahydrodipicolinate synthase [Terriglobus roseus]SEC37675.1 4-hydroxy-tetrahydrodipicolinate synthase [Terriglobus roseus]
MEPAIFHGLGTAIVTPFHTDESVDHASLRKLVEAQIAGGVDFLVACGSTGEASTLSEDETIAVITTVLEAAQGRIPVMAGCTHNSTREAVRRSIAIAKIPGLSGILTANPYYNKPSQQGQYLHFKAIADAIAPLPLLLYNIPGRTAANLEPATLMRLAQLPNVVGIKESSGNLAQIGEILALKPADFSVFAGDDYLALPIIAGGGAGLISVASNVAPKLVSDLIKAALVHDLGAAREFAKELHAVNNALFSEPNPAPAKAVLAMMDLIEGDTLRLPMLPVSDATREKLRAVATDLGLMPQ